MAVSEKTALRHQKWKREILEIIRHSPNPSRITVKRQSGLSMDSTLLLIDELLEEGLILSLGKSENSRIGRKPTLLTINDNGCFFIGVRFSTGGVYSACMDFAKQIAEENHCYKMMLLTGSKEESTLNFYRNAGYNSSDKTAFIQWIDM